MSSMNSLVSTFRNQAAGTFTHEDVTKIASLAAQEAEQRIMYKQAAVQQERQRVAGTREKVASAMDFVTRVRMLVKHAEMGDLTEEELEVLPELVEEASTVEDDLAGALLENEDLADAQAEALIEAASEDPELAAELIAEIDGLDVSGDDVDEASDVVAGAMLADPADGEKAASIIKIAHTLLGTTTPVASLLIQKIAHNKGDRYLRSIGHR